MIIKINHNPFAGESLYREIVPIDAYPYVDKCCYQCAGTNRYGNLFKYYIVPDDTKILNPIKGKFCCISCMRKYHGLI